MTTLATVVQTTDGTSIPTGVPYTLADAKEKADGAAVLDRLFGELHLSNSVLQSITTFLLPPAQI
jgi:hypothetical protein